VGLVVVVVSWRQAFAGIGNNLGKVFAVGVVIMRQMIAGADHYCTRMGFMAVNLQPNKTFLAMCLRACCVKLICSWWKIRRYHHAGDTIPTTGQPVGCKSERNRMQALKHLSDSRITLGLYIRSISHSQRNQGHRLVIKRCGQTACGDVALHLAAV
jgi:predicted NBD/HSP70 family sugar kinase